MITIRPYREDDAETVGRLIAETYTRYNLDFFLLKRGHSSWDLSNMPVPIGDPIGRQLQK